MTTSKSLLAAMSNSGRLTDEERERQRRNHELEEKARADNRAAAPVVTGIIDELRVAGFTGCKVRWFTENGITKGVRSTLPTMCAYRFARLPGCSCSECEEYWRAHGNRER